MAGGIRQGLNECVSEHTVHIYDRGGVTRLWTLGKVSMVRYTRVRDDISEATITLNMEQCEAQASILDQIEPMRHELVIFEGDKRRWEGPITLVTETRHEVEINAKDVIYYLTKTVMMNAYDNAYPDVTEVVARANGIIVIETDRKETQEQLLAPGLPSYNIIDHIVLHMEPDDAKTSASTKMYQYKVSEHLDNLAADSGLDYTAVGRSIHLWDTHRSIGAVQTTLTEQDFLGDVIISRYGSELVTLAYVTDGMGQAGFAGGVDDYYGLIENLYTAYDEETDESVPTQAELDSQALRGLDGKNPVPLIVRIPENSTLDPKSLVSMDELIPGAHVQLRAKLLVRTYTQLQKIDSVRVEETSRGKTVQISLSPAPLGDTE